MCTPARIREESQMLKAILAHTVYTHRPGAGSETRSSVRARYSAAQVKHQGGTAYFTPLCRSAARGLIFLGGMYHGRTCVYV